MNTNITANTTAINIPQVAPNKYSSTMLHSILEIHSEHSHWIKRSLSRANLIENEDFVTAAIFDGSGKAVKDYHLTEDSALQIAMMSATEKGEKVRKYFLALRKAYIAELETKLSISSNQVKVLTLDGSITTKAKQQNYLTAMEIKDVLELSTSAKVITTIGTYYAVPSIEAGVRTFWSLTEWLAAFKEWKKDSIPVGTVTYEHLFTNVRWESK